MLGDSDKHMEIPNYAISRSLTNNWIIFKKSVLRYFLSRLMLAQGTFLTYYLSWVTLTNLNHFPEIIGPVLLRIIRISHGLELYLIFHMFWFHSKDLVLLNCIHSLPRHNDSSKQMVIPQNQINRLFQWTKVLIVH